MIKKILIANRGEVAVRIIRSCWEMGIETIAIYSTEDKDSMHVKLADHSICIGSSSIEESYLNMHSIITTAKLCGADAIHPGYGFLSENSKFAALCRKANIIFIGPHEDTIELMGNKIKALEIAQKCNIPTIPGSKGIIKCLEKGLNIAEEIGYPVLIKAVNGGGGKGIRIVNSTDEFENSYNMCSKEALRAFGSGDIYIEKYIERPRHIEVQILADKQGNVVVLGDRDCTIQRNNQKIVEEAPTSILEEDIKKRIMEYAKLLAIKCNYEGVGTIEFLVDKDKNFYFMEMNTRLQVEHPVTEMITNIDLVKEQINIANGNPLNLTQEDIKLNGYSIECRINAENPDLNFMASFGKVEYLNIPGGNGIRIETDLYVGKEITPIYDSNIAKVIVHASNRDECIAKMKRALYEFVIIGVETNIEFLIKVLNHESILLNSHDTNIINKLLESKYFKGENYVSCR